MDPPRLMAAEFIAYCLHQNYVIVSIDECNFTTEMFRSKMWKPLPRVIREYEKERALRVPPRDIHAIEESQDEGFNP